ncbi:hypothetical protein PR048_006246, partial [Dryococelus australis]
MSPDFRGFDNSVSPSKLMYTQSGEVKTVRESGIVTRAGRRVVKPLRYHYCHVGQTRDMTIGGVDTWSTRYRDDDMKI